MYNKLKSIIYFLFIYLHILFIMKFIIKKEKEKRINNKEEK